MSYYFIDSSALVKRYVAETGTGWIRSITVPSAGNTIIVAHITQVEIVSGVMRRKREGSITERTSSAVRLLIDRHVSREYRVISLAEQIIQRAEDLLGFYALRAYDSIQLASALESNVRLVGAGLPAIIFVSSDARLMTVAVAEGLITDDPGAHP